MVNLYILGPADQGNGLYYLMNQDGYCMASHFCSSVGYAKGDLLLGRPERLEKWKEYLSDGFQLEYLEKGSDTYVELLKKNEAFADQDAMDKYVTEILKENVIPNQSSDETSRS